MAVCSTPRLISKFVYSYLREGVQQESRLICFQLRSLVRWPTYFHLSSQTLRVEIPESEGSLTYMSTIPYHPEQRSHAKGE